MIQVAGYLFLVSLVLGLCVTPLAARLGRRWNVLDHPGKRKIHKDPIPLSGGWAIFLTLTVVLWGHFLAALLIRGTSLESQLPESFQRYLAYTPDLFAKIAIPYAGAAIVFFLGLFDDIRGMSVKLRLVFQCAIAVTLVAIGIRPELGFLPGWIGAILAVVWIVGLMNAFNFLDGLDGLSAGIAFIATGAMSTIMLIGNQPNMAFLLAVIGGTFLGFLRSNSSPAKLFLGSSGSLLIGYLMALTSVLVTFSHGSNQNAFLTALIPILIMALPLYDTTSVVLIRLLKRRSIAIGDQSHFHHRLLKLGFSHRQTVIFIWLIAFAIAVSAVRLADSTLLQSALIMIQIVGIFMLLIIAERVAGKARRDVLDRRRIRRETSRTEFHDPDRKPSDIISIN